MKSSVLRPDDFKVGMFVTVKDLVDTTPDFDEGNARDPMHMMMMMQEGQHPTPKHHLEMLKGSVIRLDAINLPFIMTTIFENIIKPGKAPKTHYASLDIRELEFMKLNEAYVNAYLGTSPMMALLQGEKFNDVQNIEGFDTLKEVLEGLMVRLDKEENKRKSNED